MGFSRNPRQLRRIHGKRVTVLRTSTQHPLSGFGDDAPIFYFWFNRTLRICFVGGRFAAAWPLAIGSRSNDHAILAIHVQYNTRTRRSHTGGSATGLRHGPL